LTPEEVRALIAQGEGQKVEFKRSLAELETGARAVAAMANTDGGHVLFGVRDDGTILGVQIGAQTKERVVQAITGNTDPTPYPSVEYVELDGRTVILVTVPRSEDRPHRSRPCRTLVAVSSSPSTGWIWKRLWLRNVRRR